MAKKKKQTIGYKYFASGHFVLCHGPIDAILKISFQDKGAYLIKEQENKTIYINKPSLFGGDEQSGGVQGNIELLFGRADQQKSSILQRICAKISDAFGGLISAYRGVCSVVFDNVYIGTAPNMPDSKWRVKRIHTRHDGQLQWYDEKAEVPKGGGVITLPGDPITDNPLDMPASLYVSRQLNADDRLIISEPELVDVRDKIGFWWGGGWSTSASDDLKPASFVSKMSGPYSRWVGGIRVKNNPRGSVYITGGTFTGIDDDGWDNYSIDFVGETLDIVIQTNNTKGIFWSNLYLQRFGVPVPGAPSGDMNPAHIIRECLVTPVWGIGVSELTIDDASFRKAADRLYAEGMGMSVKWTESTSINEFVDNIKEHINAQLYLDRVTNKWKLYLIRDDYNVDDLISLDESNIRNLDFERRTLAECVNSVTVTYYEREREKESTITVQDIARIAQQGGVVSQDVDYKGFTYSDLASRVALRDLKTLSSTLASVSFDVDESFSESWHEGMPFKLSDESYGLSEAVMRIRTIKRGDGINNTVYVEAIEDSFSSPMQSVIEYVPSVVSDDTAQNAEAIAFEVPYIELVEQYGQDEVDTKLSKHPELGYVGMAAIRPNNKHINASLYVDAGAGYDERATLDFCPNATLKSAIGRMDSSFELENIAEFELLETNHRIQIGDEIMVLVSFDASTHVITVKRGCFDTLPQVHSAGSKIFGWDNYSGIDNLEYLSGENLSLKALTLTGSDALELGHATAHILPLSNRAIRPYPAANVKINGEYYPAEVETDLVITWVDRNRTQQTGGIALGYFESGVTLEIGVTYQLILIERDVDEVKLRTQNLSLGSLNTYTFATSAMNANTRTIEMTLKSLRDG
ncbi:phage tail protein, partial [Acinetobacter johnsonii]|uniref:phage tail protein n=1 Tax=Acinetobacter johnsonii TaxID=40214 RepID=UPI0032B5A7C8